MKTWPAIGKQLLAVALLCLVAIFATGWAGLYCYHFGSPFQSALLASLTFFQSTESGPEQGLGEFYDSFVPGYWMWTALAVVWVVAMCAYFWLGRKSQAALALGLIPTALFTWGSFVNLQMAWPACNAF